MNPPIHLAIDPGESPGFAWGRAGKLEGCSADFPAGLIHFEAKRVEVFIEYPAVRPGTPKAASIVRLAWTAGEIVGRLKAGGVASVKEVPVPRWKGNLEKWMHHPRILEVLSPEERRVAEHALGDLDHYVRRCKLAHTVGGVAKDVLDAVGLLLWSFDRRT